jgi:septum site-determining protein MinC
VSDLVQGGTFSLMIVRVDDPTDPSFEGRLADRVARSPAFFANAPVVLDLKACDGLATADSFRELRALFKRQHLMPVGIQNGNATQVRAAMNADLAAFPTSGPKASPAAAPPPAQSQPSTPVAASAPNGRTRVVTQPVRSGAQIYARGGDIIILASVSAGAEVIADGNVHIYGTLRGRAIAGAAGDAEARIFVGKLEAELLCVAGHYLVSEAIGAEFRGHQVQVSMVEDKLTIALSQV